ncbi:glycogen-binding domain-containing protein [Sandaracinus amylolyticus]|uniref:glycogen-binding domain-containing protein n=1 Tax=Sandaracinus amylolyticus TaxID=927083 RepID=UPI001F1E7EBD|nr:glycogen-binding domain-containing protein [Sandaracinus amylolyticus]
MTACASDPGSLDVDAGPGYRRDGSPSPLFRPPCRGDGGASDGASCGDGEVPLPDEDAGPPPPPPPPCNEITFTLHQPGATSVWLSGSFLADASGTWPDTPESGALELVNDGSGTWSATHLVEPIGRHLYKFIVDGTTWIPPIPRTTCASPIPSVRSTACSPYAT